MIDESTPNPTFGQAFEFYMNCPGVLPSWVIPYAWATARLGRFSANMDVALEEYFELKKEGFFAISHG
jgi:hypothetical protein